MPAGGPFRLRPTLVTSDWPGCDQSVILRVIESLRSIFRLRGNSMLVCVDDAFARKRRLELVVAACARFPELAIGGNQRGQVSLMTRFQRGESGIRHRSRPLLPARALAEGLVVDPGTA